MQFLAWALYDDNSTEDVTGQANWSLDSNAPHGSSLFGGLFTAGKPFAETSVKLLASFTAGSGLRTGSSDVVVLPGLTVRIEYDFETVVFNNQWLLNAQAIVAGNSSPVASGDILWDMNDDGVFGDKVGANINESYSLKGSYRAAVQVQSGTETATAAVNFTTGATPDSAPEVSGIKDAFSETLLSPTGDVVTNLPASTSKLAVVIHGLKDDGRMEWVQQLCEAIESSVPAPMSVIAYDWKQMADPSLLQYNINIKESVFIEAIQVKAAGRAAGIMLAERLKGEQAFGSISYSTAIHLIGHGAGGFVAGECALTLKKAGFTNLHVTMLDTPAPHAGHIKQGWKTDRYASSWYGGRFENDTVSRFLLDRQRCYNAAVSNKLETVKTTFGDNAFSSNGYSYSYPFVNAGSSLSLDLGFDVAPGSDGSPDSSYRFAEIVDSGLPDNPEDADNRHGFAREWYKKTVIGTVAHDGFAYSNLLGSAPFPQSMAANTPQPLGDPPAPVVLGGFTYFGTASGSAGVHTFTENADAGMWKNLTLPIGSETLRFRYQFTTAGDGDFLAAFWGDEAVLVICPDTDSARAGFMEMEADVSRFGGQTGNLVFKLVSRGAVNAVAQIDQLQIVLSDDPDDDGLANDQEATYDSNAHNADTDSDGLSDYDEVMIHGTDPTKADSDVDMVPDSAELTASTNPLDENSFLRPRMERGAAGQPELHWQGVSGRTYSIVRSFDLSGMAFDFIRTEVPGAGVDCTVADPDSTVNPRAFYWVLPE